MAQLALLLEENPPAERSGQTLLVRPFSAQLLKWIGNKQRFAPAIIRYFPDRFGTYHEPFLGSGGVLGVLSPRRAEAADVFAPLIGIWQQLKRDPEVVKDWYSDRWSEMKKYPKVEGYERIKGRYNAQANPADLLFLCRACYGGVVRFRLRDGYMSTPCGVHEPVSPESFVRRVDLWVKRVSGTEFFHRDYEESFARAKEGDVIYCDPPYSDSQTILYGAQKFALETLFRCIEKAKARGVFVALSIDGSKKSGDRLCDVDIPRGLFAKETAVVVGRSMLRRFQMGGQSLEAEVVKDRLLLTH